jgi:hypothetical protein
MTESIQTAAKKMLAAPSPVLFLDTCSILDIVNAGHLETLQAQIIISANHLLRMTVGPPGIWLVTTVMVQEEFQRNIRNSVATLEAQIKILDTKIAQSRDAVQYFSPEQVVPSIRFRAFGLSEKLGDLATSFAEAAIVLEDDVECLHAARARNNAGRPPSHRKQQLPDCEIVEHYLGLVRLLRKNGFGNKCIFVSSNSQDYGKPAEPSLQDEFSAHELEFVSDLAWARSLIPWCTPEAPLTTQQGDLL